MTDPKIPFQALKDHFETQTDIVETVAATKGVHYAAFLNAVASITNIIRATNGMICKEYPEHLVEITLELQLTRIDGLIEPFFMKEFPEDGTEEATKKRHAACSEFHKNLEMLVKQRVDLENKINQTIIGG